MTADIPAIDCQDLTFAWKDGEDPVLEDINLNLVKGDRCLLLGANGGGSGMRPRPSLGLC